MASSEIRVTSAWRIEVRKTFALALPIITVQLGMKAMGTVDVMMVGHHSPDSLAAITLGELFLWTLIIGGGGILMALDPVISQAVGAQDETSIRHNLQRGLILAVILSIPVILLALPADLVFRSLAQPKEIIPAAAEYVRYSLPGILPFFLYAVLRACLQALSRTRPIVVVILATNLLNIWLDWLLIYGHWGFPELGLKGSAIATSICRWLMLFGLCTLGTAHLGRHLKTWDRQSVNPTALWRLAKLGIPIGTQHLLEMGVFATTALLVGWFGAIPLAGHQIAINLASLSFMVPLGISSATAIRVGYAVGRGDFVAARHSAIASMICSTAIMAGFAALFLVIPQIAALPYTNDPEVIAVAVLLIPIAGVFQVFDGVQVVSIGVLRGLGKTLVATVVSLVGFWVLGLPLGCYLAFEMGMGAAGLWWGLVAGLASVASILMLYVRRGLKSHPDRIQIE